VNAVEAGVHRKKDVQRALDEAVIVWNKKLGQKMKHPAPAPKLAQGGCPKNAQAWLFMLPALAVLAGFPFGRCCSAPWLAFTDYSLIKPPNGSAWITSAPSSTTTCSSRG